MRTFSIKKIGGGGLDTAEAINALPPEMSPDMLNMEPTDTLAIRRRRGGEQIEHIGSGAMPVTAVRKFYKSDSTDKYWVAIRGQVFSRLATSQQSSGSLYGFDATSDVNIFGVSPDAEYTNGSAFGIQIGSAQFNIPVCNSIDLRYWSLGGSYKVDNGSWQSLTASHGGRLSISSLAATTHILQLKPPVSNNKGVKLTANDPYKTSTGSTRYRSIRKFDMAYGDHVPRNMTVQVTAGMGTCTSLDTVVMTLHDADGKEVGRAKATADGYLNADGKNVSYIYLQCESKTQGHYCYFDALTVNGYPVFDGDSKVGGMTQVTGGGEYNTASNSLGDVPALVIDRINYSLNSSWTGYGDSILGTPVMAELNNKIWYGSASASLKSFDGTTITSYTNVPSPLHLVAAQNRLFAVTGSNKSLLQWSVVGSPASWTGGNLSGFWTASKEAGRECTGLAAFRGGMFYFAHDKTWVLDLATVGTSDMKAEVISESHGCINSKTLVSTPNALVFLSSDGVRAYGTIPGVNTTDGSGFSLLSKSIKNLLDGKDLSKAFGLYYKDAYWLFCDLDQDGKNETALVCYLDRSNALKRPVWVRHSWGAGYGATSTVTGVYSAQSYKYSTMPAGATSGDGIKLSVPLRTFEAGTVTRGDEYGMYVTDADRNLCKLDTGNTDFGSSIHYYYDTPPLAPDNTETVKHFRTLYATIRSDSAQSVEVRPQTDDVVRDSFFMEIPTSANAQPVRAALNGRGTSLSLGFSGFSTSEPPEISGFTIQYLSQPIR